jgi:hypothetical protein
MRNVDGGSRNRIIAIGAGGWASYIGEFGLLSGAIILLAIRARRYSLERETAALAVILAGNLIDLIPNAGLTPVTWIRLILSSNNITDITMIAAGMTV